MDCAIQQVNEDTVKGFLHNPRSPTGDGVVLAHGAGSDAKSRLLVVVAEALCDAGFSCSATTSRSVKSDLTGHRCPGTAPVIARDYRPLPTLSANVLQAGCYGRPLIRRAPIQYAGRRAAGSVRCLAPVVLSPSSAS